MAELQKNWLQDFGRDDRNHNARQRLIDALSCDSRVRTLLTALNTLASLPKSPTEWLPDGTMTLQVSIAEIQRALELKSEQATRDYIKLAKATPYLSSDEVTNRPRTYAVHWMAIVDCRPVATEQRDALTSTARRSPNQRGEQRAEQGTRQAVKLGGSTEAAPQSTPQTAPQLGSNLPPNCPPTAPQIGVQLGSKMGGSSLRPVFYFNSNQEPVLKTGVGRPPNWRAAPYAFSSIASPDPNAWELSGKWWRWWKSELATRSLANPHDVEELFQLVVASGLIPDSRESRFRVFTQAAVDRRKSKTPKAMFRENVAARRWFATCVDEDAARAMIESLDRAGADSRTLAASTSDASAAVQAEQSRVEDGRARRAERMRQLEADLGQAVDLLSHEQLLELLAGDTIYVRLLRQRPADLQARDDGQIPPLRAAVLERLASRQLATAEQS